MVSVFGNGMKREEGRGREMVRKLGLRAKWKCVFLSLSV